MVALWVLMVIPYLVGAGFCQAYVHQHPGHNQRKCDRGDSMPCFLWAGWGWPLLIAGLLVYACWKLGERLEYQRPVHRRQRREQLRSQDLRSLP